MCPPCGRRSRFYLVVLAVAVGAWALDTFVPASEGGSILLSMAAPAVGSGVLAWHFRRTDTGATAARAGRRRPDPTSGGR